eukprot:scaffold263_cov251-Pinguiococcus_pyrenoidosus.AAC.3
MQKFPPGIARHACQRRIVDRGSWIVDRGSWIVDARWTHVAKPFRCARAYSCRRLFNTWRSMGGLCAQE